MIDTRTPERRSANMAAVKGKNTKPEIAVRRMLHALGFRFRLHRRDLPGVPDVYLPKHRTVLFVHGCFWHGHPGCRRAVMPATRPEFWRDKIGKNQTRDAEVLRLAAALGLNVVVVWECELKDADALRRRLVAEIGRGAERVRAEGQG